MRKRLKTSISRRLAPGLLLCGLGLAALPARAEYLELFTTNSTNFRATENGTATVDYTLRMRELQSSSFDPLSPDVLSSYDIGIIYNPAFLTLQSFSFHSLNLLGDPTVVDAFGLPEVTQEDHLDNVNNPPGTGTVRASPAPNSTWDWRDNSNVNAGSTGATYMPDATKLGTPCPPDGDCSTAYSINEGSLRISAFSWLDADTLQTLQGGANNDITPLFTLSFLVNLDQAGRTPINIVLSNDYSGATGNALDLKYSFGDTAQYPKDPRNGEIIIAAPLPGSLLLMAPGLLLLRRRRVV